MFLRCHTWKYFSFYVRTPKWICNSLVIVLGKNHKSILFTKEKNNEYWVAHEKKTNHFFLFFQDEWVRVSCVGVGEINIIFTFFSKMLPTFSILYLDDPESGWVWVWAKKRHLHLQRQPPTQPHTLQVFGVKESKGTISFRKLSSFIFFGKLSTDLDFSTPKAFSQILWKIVAFFKLGMPQLQLFDSSPGVLILTQIIIPVTNFPPPLCAWRWGREAISGRNSGNWWNSMNVISAC